MSPDFTTALLNGREQVSTGDNRGVEFDQYPSDLLQAVVVYKTPDASLIGQGLAGTADMRTIRPLTYGQRAINAGIRYEWTEQDSLNAGSPTDGGRLSLSYVDQFANDTVGIAFGYSHMDNPSQEERYNGWGYPTTGNGDLVLGGAKPFVRSGELERDGFLGVLEYAPSDTFTTAVDVYYSEFQETQWLRGIELPLWWSAAQLQPGETVEDGLVTQGTFDNVVGVVRNDIDRRDTELTAIGWNMQWDLANEWWIETDLSYSQVDREDILVESYSGTGNPQNPNQLTDTLGFDLTNSGAVFDPTVDYSDPNQIILTSPQGWGGNVVPGGQLGYVNNPTIEDSLEAIRLSFGKELDGGISNMEFGVNFQTREKEKIADEFFPALADPANCLLFDQTDPTLCIEAPIPDVIGTTDLSFLGIDGMVSYNPLALYNSDTYDLSRNPNGDVAIKSWLVEEDVAIAYAQFGIDTEWGNVPVTGNFGAQVVYTDQSSTALAVDGGGSGFTGVPNTGGKDFTEVLPSLNLIFDFGDERYVRFAAARTLARARMDELRASGTWSYNPTFEDSTDINNSPWGGDLGNPELDPWIANAFDLSFEKYFQDGLGYFALGVFYKDLDTYIFTDTIVADFTGFPVPPGQNPALSEGLITAPQNGKGGTISGVEVAVQIDAGLFSPSLEGFGLVMNGSFTDSEIQPNPDNPAEPIPGLSEEVINTTLYYENDRFGARVSSRYRSEFRGEVSGFGAGRTLRDVDSENVIDGQLSYFFGGRAEGLSAYLQGYNLTDEPFRTVNSGDPRQLIDYQSYGRWYMIGLSYTTN